MERTRLFLVRHGQVVNHHEQRYNGHFDVDITEKGEEQMERLADFLSAEPIAAVYSSDLKRASKGACIIACRFAFKTVEVPSLRELFLGRWEGLTREEASVKFPEEAGFSFRDLATGSPRGGESLLDLKKRVLPAVEKILATHRGSSILLVAHGGVNRVILCEAMGLGLENFFRIEQDYGCLNLIDYFSDGIKVVKMLNGGPNQDLGSAKLY